MTIQKLEHAKNLQNELDNLNAQLNRIYNYGCTGGHSFDEIIGSFVRNWKKHLTTEELDNINAIILEAVKRKRDSVNAEFEAL